MYFELSLFIKRQPSDVFVFLRDKDKYPQKQGSPVLVLEQTSPGSPSVGTRYREVVQMMPFIRGEILSVITRFESGQHLEEDFQGAGMKGHLAYQFVRQDGGTRLIQRETLYMKGILKLFSPIVRLTLSRQLHKRLQGIKEVLESGYMTQD